MPLQWVAKEDMTDVLSKYECARVLGLRYLELQQSAACNHQKLRAHVVHEMLRGDNPLSVRRVMPDGQYEDWKVSDLQISDDLREHLKYVAENQ